MLRRRAAGQGLIGEGLGIDVAFAVGLGVFAAVPKVLDGFAGGQQAPGRVPVPGRDLPLAWVPDPAQGPVPPFYRIRSGIAAPVTAPGNAFSQQPPLSCYVNFIVTRQAGPVKEKIAGFDNFPSVHSPLSGVYWNQ